MTKLNVKPVGAIYSIIDLKTAYAEALARMLPKIANPHHSSALLTTIPSFGQTERESLEWLNKEIDRGSTHVKTSGLIVEKQYAAASSDSLLNQAKDGRAVGIVLPSHP